MLVACSGGNQNDLQKPDTYTVTFVQSGQEDVVKTVNAGDTLTDVPSVVPVTGYTVVWDPDDLEKLTDISESVTVNAVETPNNYKVFYDLGERKNDTQNIAITGGDASLKTDSATGKKYCPVTFDAEYNLAKPACNGYKFVGWIIESTQTAFTNGTYTTASDITIVAQWEIDETHDRWWTEEY